MLVEISSTSSGVSPFGCFLGRSYWERTPGVEHDGEITYPLLPGKGPQVELEIVN